MAILLAICLDFQGKILVAGFVTNLITVWHSRRDGWVCLTEKNTAIAAHKADFDEIWDAWLMQHTRKEIFDDSQLDPQDRQRYGTHPLGRHLLQARRLLEAGVRFIKVNSYHWDTHGDNFNMSQRLVPQVDRPFAALVNDLDDRGMLDNVLVIVISEFGRTPVINSRLGRDHWPDCWSIALAGCGVKRGAVIGRTTPDGAFVDGKGYDIGDLFHTIFALLGIDAKKTRYRHKGQRLAIAHDDCEPIKELML